MTLQPHKPKLNPIAKIVHAMGCSFKGLKAAWQHESSFRLEVGVGLILMPSGVYFASEDWSLWMIIILGIGVLIAEIINAAVEAAIDRISLDFHPLSGQAKDLGSAAVFLCQMLFLSFWVYQCWQFFKS